MDKIVVAAVQATPVFLDRDATVEKAVGLIKEAGALGARLAVFPETFIPTYPDWCWRATPWQAGSAFHERLLANSVEIPSPATEALGEAARAAEAYVAMGCNEIEPGSGTIYNTLFYIGPDGALLGKHRKLMPTGAERLVWGQGDGSTLRTYETPFGRLGGLICWENYMPLARAALYGAGIDVYVAPTWDNSQTWVASMQHIAKEGRCYVIGVTSFQRGSDVPADVPMRDELWSDGPDDWLSQGNSVIVGPRGDILAGPLVGEEGILTAEIDPMRARAIRHEFDAVGHYSRPDVLRLHVDTRPKRTVVFEQPDDGD